MADAEALATLRGGTGESYRQSVAAILADRPGGLTFRDLLAAVRERQCHDMHRGTLRAVLHAGGFVCREGRWQAVQDEGQSRRLLRESVVLAANNDTAARGQGQRSHSRLLEVATSVAERCRVLRKALRPSEGESKAGEQ